MRERWYELCNRLSTGWHYEADWLYACVEALYAFPPRAYHNLGHIEACLRVLDEARGFAERPDEVEFALWLHDCIYDPIRKDNEERSAKVAGMMARELGFSDEVAERTRGLILATTHTMPGTTADARLIADVDMSILGAEWGEYERYVRQVREEYAFVTDEKWRAGRGAFLREMLGRERIYQVEGLRGRWEARARENMGREAAGLG